MKWRQYKNLLTNRVLQHALFWCVSFWIFSNTFKVSTTPQKIDYIYTALFHISILVAVYVNLSLLIPYFSSKQKYVFYFVGLTANMSFSIIINEQTFNTLTAIILPDYYFISYYEYADIAKFLFVYIALTHVIKTIEIVV